MQFTRREGMKKALQDQFPVELKKYRLGEGLSQEQMARTLKVSLRSYIDLEHGTTSPSALTLAMFLMLLPEDELKEKLKNIQTALEAVP